MLGRYANIIIGAGLFLLAGCATPSQHTIANAPPPADPQVSANDAYRKGYTLEQDGNLAESIIWYRKAADQNHPRGLYAVGYAYDLGRGLERDYREALIWYLKAAETYRLPEAQRSIGLMYEAGKGVAVDYTKAMTWYRLAADQGWATAMTSIANMYAGGRGVPRDRDEARRWMEKAANSGDKNAREWLEKNPAQST